MQNYVYVCDFGVDRTIFVFIRCECACVCLSAIISDYGNYFLDAGCPQVYPAYFLGIPSEKQMSQVATERQRVRT